MVLYYMGHTVVNQIKKLLQTWVAVFLLVCILFGLVIGLGASAIGDLAGGDGTEQEEKGDIEGYPEDIYGEEAEEYPEETPVPEHLGENLMELAAGGAVIAVFVFSALTADKNGGKIFLMADVNLLFSAPLRPQTVLLFRLLMQVGASVGAGLYLLFQLPNLIDTTGMSVFSAVYLVFLFAALFVYSKLLSVFVYTLTSTREGLKKYITPAVYGFLLLIAALYGGAYISSGKAVWMSLTGFFNSPITRLIPVYGWIKGAAREAFLGNWLAVLLYSVLLIAGAVAFTSLIWRMKADFYEDAMSKSEEMAEVMQAASEGRRKKRVNDRADRLQRDGMRYGKGASVYFFKAMYNRFRFAHFRVLTKTSETYLLTSAVICAFLILTEIKSLYPVALVLAGMVFFRSLGNPISEDLALDSFFSVPESAYSKVFFSLMGGTVNCLLDLLPAFLLGAVFMRSDILSVSGLLLLAVSLDWYSSNVGLFIEVSLSTALNKNIRGVIQLLFIYFGLLPIAAVVAVGMILGYPLLSFFGGGLLCTLIGVIFFALSPMFVENGRR